MKTPAIEIVPFSAQHANGVVALILGIQQIEFEIPITIEAQADLKDIPHFYQQENGNFWVALAQDQVVGTIALLDIGMKQGALRKMFVNAAYRGADQGVARDLLETLFCWCRTRDVQEIFLGTTSKFVAAQRFYEKNGFVEITRRELPSRFPVMAVDSKFYCKKV